MKCKITPLILSIFFTIASAHAQVKVVGECALQFEILEKQSSQWVPIGTKNVLVKGSQCKTIFSTPQLVQALIFNTQFETATILKDIGQSHFLQEIKYPPANLPTMLSMKESADSAISILGYLCKKVQLTWSDGLVYEIQYTNEMMTTVNAFEAAFKDIPGLVLAYTIIPQKGNSIQYHATSIDLSPISLNQFNVNKDQYQIID
jgi:hypothetical protein